MSEWTVDSLKSHLESLAVATDKRYEDRFLAQEKAVESALTAAREATSKAEAAAEKRFDAVNEFRAQLSDQATTFMPRIESENRHATAAEKIDVLATRLDRSEGHQGGITAATAGLLAAASVIAGITFGVINALT